MLATFSPGVFGEFVWDDMGLIVENEKIRDWSAIPHAFTETFWDVSGLEEHTLIPLYGRLYRPVVTVAYVLQYKAFGLNPLGWHLVSIVVHGLCVLLCLHWLERRLEAKGHASAIIGAALFGLHPSRVETVTWISGSTDLWMAFFALLGLWSWERFRGIGGAVLASLCFVLSLLSKETGAVVPFMLVADVLLQKKASERPMELAIVLAVGLLSAIIRLYAFPPPPLDQCGLFESVARALVSLGFYVALVLWPWSPSVQVAPRSSACLFSPLTEWWALGLGLLFLVGVLVLAFKGKAREWAADLLWFIGPLLPVLNVVSLGSYTLVAERFLYLPMLGIAKIAARVIGRAGVYGIGFSLLYFVACAYVCVGHEGHFLNERALWDHEYRENPKNLFVLQQISTVALKEKRTDEALEFLREGREVALQAGDLGRAAWFALTEVAKLLSLTPDADQASLEEIRKFYERFAKEGVLRLGAEMDFRVPDKVRRLFMNDVARYLGPRATVCARTQRLEEAKDLARLVLEKAPHKVEGYLLLAFVEGRMGHFGEAMEVLEKASKAFKDDKRVLMAQRQILRAWEMARQEPKSEEERRVRDARVQLTLGSPQGARASLGPPPSQGQEAIEVLMTRIEIELADGRLFEAERLAKEAMARNLDPAYLRYLQETLKRARKEGAKERIEAFGPGLP